MAKPSPVALAKQLLGILKADLPALMKMDDYLHGRHDRPYMPDSADAEYQLLADRSVANWFPLLVGTPSQALYVDGFRRGSENSSTNMDSPEWDHFKRSRLAARQVPIHRGALAYGHSFALTERTKKGVVTKGLSALRTSAVFEDPANDDDPYAMLTVVEWGNAEQKRLAKARMWDDRFEYVVQFTTLDDLKSVRVVRIKRHGADECPGTRFAASVDLEGRTMGVIWPMIVLQDRINQTVFDLLVAQTYNSTEVRTVTGMAPPLQRDPETGDPLLDENGNPKPVPMNYNARRFLFAEDPEAKFGSLPGSALDGFINSIDMSIRHLAAISQTPPHHLLGQIANLSAEALQAAETSLLRKIEEFRKSFGEAWQRVFRLAAKFAGDARGADDYSGEIIWRDMESKSLAQSADALGKMKEQLGIPAEGLWHRVPGATQTEITEWKRLAKDENTAGTIGEAITRATPDRLRVSAPAA